MIIIIRALLAGVLVATYTACSLNHHAPENIIQIESVVPVPRSKEYSWMSIAEWKRLHAEDVAIARQGDAELLFLGDSITAGWPQSIWRENFQEFNPANFGIGGDQTQNVLWRLRNGAIGNLNPRAVVLLIGVNNFGHSDHSPQHVYEGARAITTELHDAFPEAKILLLGILPFGELAGDPNRVRVKEANRLLQALDKQSYISFYDFGDVFLKENGDISRDLMADFLHPTAKGYELFAEKLAPILRQWLDTDNSQ